MTTSPENSRTSRPLRLGYVHASTHLVLNRAVAVSELPVQGGPRETAAGRRKKIEIGCYSIQTHS
jgi:hypothetical protein